MQISAKLSARFRSKMITTLKKSKVQLQKKLDMNSKANGYNILESFYSDRISHGDSSMLSENGAGNQDKVRLVINPRRVSIAISFF